MSFRFVDSFRAGTGWNCRTCRVSWQNKFVKLMHLVDFIAKKFVTMYGHMNIKKSLPIILVCLPVLVIRRLEFFCRGISPSRKCIWLDSCCWVGSNAAGPIDHTLKAQLNRPQPCIKFLHANCAVSNRIRLPAVDISLHLLKIMASYFRSTKIPAEIQPLWCGTDILIVDTKSNYARIISVLNYSVSS